MSISRYITLSLLCAALVPAVGHAAGACQQQAQTDYERVFCQLKASRHGRNLPTLDEFRRNPADMQYLLLKRLARRQGLSLSAPRRKPASKPTSKPANKPGPAVPPAAPHDRPAAARQETIWPEAAEPAQCRYTIRQIRCAQRNYSLRLNQANSHLAAGALGPGNSLQMASRRAGQSEQDWLAQAYTAYIEAMLSIGLAGSSSSYSAFAHSYYQLSEAGVDFTARHAKMFELLKKDKKTLAVARRLPGQAPRDQDCEQLTTKLMVCYSQGKNLVYQAID